MPDTLTALDATFLELEQRDEGALMSIGGVMVFDPLPGGGVPTLEQVRINVARRLRRLPRYSQRLSSPRTGGLAWPRWVDDERFDVRNHLGHVALPGPGGEAELLDWTGDFFSHRLDRTRPLWELVLIEGLEHGRWALAQKTHHCMVDGVGSVDVVQLLLDAEPEPPAEPPAATDAAAEHDGLRSIAARHAPQPLVQAAQAGAVVARAGLSGARHPREAFARSLALADLLVRDEVLAAPHTSLNQPIGSTRRFAIVTVPIAELAAIRRRFGGSINDVILAACAAGLRRLLLERGEQPPPLGLRAMVPMNLRESSEHLALGNRVSSLFVELPVANGHAFARYRKIVASTSRLKRSRAAQGATLMLD